MSRVRVSRLRPMGEASPCSTCGDVPAVIAHPCKRDPMHGGICERCARRAVHKFDLLAAGRVKFLHPGDSSEETR